MKSLPYTFGTKISMEATKIEITKEVMEAIQVGFKRRISPKEIRTYSSLNTNVCFIFYLHLPDGRYKRNSFLPK